MKKRKILTALLAVSILAGCSNTAEPAATTEAEAITEAITTTEATAETTTTTTSATTTTTTAAATTTATTTTTSAIAEETETTTTEPVIEVVTEKAYITSMPPTDPIPVLVETTTEDDSGDVLAGWSSDYGTELSNAVRYGFQEGAEVFFNAHYTYLSENCDKTEMNGGFFFIPKGAVLQDDGSYYCANNDGVYTEEEKADAEKNGYVSIDNRVYMNIDVLTLYNLGYEAWADVSTREAVRTYSANKAEFDSVEEAQRAQLMMTAALPDIALAKGYTFMYDIEEFNKAYLEGQYDSSTDLVITKELVEKYPDILYETDDDGNKVPFFLEKNTGWNLFIKSHAVEGSIRGTVFTTHEFGEDTNGDGVIDSDANKVFLHITFINKKTNDLHTVTLEYEVDQGDVPKGLGFTSVYYAIYDFISHYRVTEVDCSPMSVARIYRDIPEFGAYDIYIEVE